MKSKLSCYQFDNQGYSLVELLVAMAITLVVMAGVYKVYVTQQDSYLLQEQVAEMQQNARIAKYLLMRDIRMVGYNPTGKLNAGSFVTSFVAKLPNDTRDDSDPDRTSTDSRSIAFTLDDNGNGVIDASLNEQIAYRVAGGDLQRFDVGNDGWLTVVENIENLAFAYGYEDDGNIIWAIDADDSDTDQRLNVKLDGNGDGAIDASDDSNDDGVIDDNDAGTPLAAPVELDKIVAVKIWLLAKTGQSDRRYSRSETYVVGNKIITKDDQNRHNLVATTVKCRNMAL